MSNKSPRESHYLLQVKALLAKVNSKSPQKDSVIERAISFYESQPAIQTIKDNFCQEINKSNEQIKVKSAKDIKLIERSIARTKREQKEYLEKLALEKDEKNQYLLGICQQILSLSEGEDFGETNRRSAKLLGTIQLLSPTEGKKVALINEQHKPVYKAVLALRLLDRLCIERKIIDPYINEYLADITPENYTDFSKLAPQEYQLFVDYVKIPVLIAAIIQDIGNYHFDAQKIMSGEEGDKDPHRTLEIEERKKLLQINYRETLTYLLEGIGLQNYIGNSKAERDKFNQRERKKFLFIRSLLKGSVNPKEGIGNLLKVPQIYTSIIFSIKSNYNYKLLPKVYNALSQNVQRGSCSSIYVDGLRKITGDFPQGYGVIYIPIDSSGKQCERYEYAIVNSLYPRNPSAPICRSATRNLTFMSHGADITVNVDANLYFPEVVKKLSSMSKERLNEILELLSSNYLERKKLDLLPRCWQTQEFFSIKKNQNIWNKK